MKRLFLTLRFDGTAYHGWQVQENAVTVQQVVQDAIEAVTGDRSALTGCSRTDSGVHANMFCCAFTTASSLGGRTLVGALNANLPENIAVTACREVPLSFHPRYDCMGKEYIYRIYNSAVRDPFLVGRALLFKPPLDAEMLNEQAQSFVGTHDFSAFRASGSSVADSVRTVRYAEVERNADEVVFRVSADGFLYNMVRIMVGTLLDISREKIDRDTLPQIISSHNRKCAGITAPAHGLYLNKVFYPAEKLMCDCDGERMDEKN